MGKKITTSFLAHCDGSVKGDFSMSSYVIVTKSSELVYQDVFRGSGKLSTTAELLALRRVLESCLRQGVLDVTIVSDELAVVNHANNKDKKFINATNKDEYNFQLKIIHALMSRFDRVNLVYKPRKFNTYADSLCHLGWENKQVRRSGGTVDLSQKAEFSGALLV